MPNTPLSVNATRLPFARKTQRTIRHGGSRLERQGAISAKARYITPGAMLRPKLGIHRRRLDKGFDPDMRIAPRMAKAGFVPAGPRGRKPAKSHMLRPKRTAGEFRPLEQLCQRRLARKFQQLVGHDVKALAQICETADLIDVEDKSWLLCPADADLLERLAMFQCELADFEPECEDEGSPDSDCAGPPFSSEDYEQTYTEDGA